MKLSDISVAGIILAAGASWRMGEPKALLTLEDGATSLARQAQTLSQAGCRHIIAVIGAHANIIKHAHEDLALIWRENAQWERGQFSSLQEGMRALLETPAVGALVIPVDVVGVPPEVMESVMEAGIRNPHLKAVVPEFEQTGGHPVYLSRAYGEYLLSLDPAGQDARLDWQLHQLQEIMRIPVNHPAIIANLNSRADLQAYKEGRS